MKLLVIGVDGGDKKIINAMAMPYLQEALRQGINLELEEDLWSRGWAEILNGRHGRDTGGFYYKPALDGSHDMSAHFGTENHEVDGLEPLWRKLASAGYKVAFMNVPTTMPAPKVDGFFVSGAGGGFNPKDGLPNVACYPDETLKFLRELAYPWQIRFMSSGIKDIDKFMNAAEMTVDKRTNAFLEFCKKYNPDFAFLVHTENTPIQNLAMVEIEEMIKNHGVPKNSFQKRIGKFCTNLDTSIRGVVDKIRPEYVMIVSDHGASPRLTSVNMNRFLQDIDLQTKKRASVRTVRSLAKQLAYLLPKRLRRILTRSAHEVAKELNRPNIDWSKTVAFGARYVPGVYVNDRSRFGGPVSGDDEIARLSQEVIDAFNKTEVALKYDLHARRYRSQYPTCGHNALLPDVWVDSPDSVFFEGDGPFAQPNSDYHTIESLNDVTRALFTGIKGRKPLACVDKGLKNCIDPSDPPDLTQIYRIIERAMEL